MTADQAAAIERLRNGPAHGIYDGVNADMVTVCDMVLAEHPADDCEPVTEEWLRSVGADVECRSEEWAATFEQTWEDRAILTIYSDGIVIATNMGHSARLNRVKTRGDVRRLCRALNIPLTEQETAT